MAKPKPNLDKPPSFCNTIDQFQSMQGDLAYTKLVDIRTTYDEYSEPTEDWDSLDADTRQQWYEDLAALHDARMDLAELGADDREEAEKLVAKTTSQGDDLPRQTHLIREAIKAVRTNETTPED